ncbi:MAG: hypothetical protein ABIN61_08660 [candidate division WOR-3 bacterium]
MEDLSSAIVKIKELIDALPLKAERVFEYMNDVAKELGVTLGNDAEPPLIERGLVIFKIWREINSINESMEAEFSEDLEETIDRKSPIYKRILEFSARLNVYHETIISNEIYKEMVERFRRIDSVLPPSHFDFTEGIQSLDSSYLTDEIINDTKESIERFKNKEFPETISYCGNASRRLTDKFAQYLHELSGRNCSSSDWGPKLGEIKTILENTQNPINLSPKSRIEWYILSNLYIVLWIRNAYAHRSEIDSRIPQWQDACRKTMVEDCDCARSAIIATLQAARYLQELLKNKNNP